MRPRPPAAAVTSQHRPSCARRGSRIKDKAMPRSSPAPRGDGVPAYQVQTARGGDSGAGQGLSVPPSDTLLPLLLATHTPDRPTTRARRARREPWLTWQRPQPQKKIK
ncbi:hypothetical protein CDD83_10205 [Cordyceps sp. RAO-2017]|nr:hypothetical protein CDD83_10205 [Cordyceps sp. RAO-2017]